MRGCTCVMGCGAAKGCMAVRVMGQLDGCRSNGMRQGSPCIVGSPRRASTGSGGGSLSVLLCVLR